jgi:hypothetical protein
MGYRRFCIHLSGIRRGLSWRNATPGGTIPGTGTAGAHSSQSSGAMTRKDIYNKAISMAHASTDNEKLRRSAELAALVEMGLGRSLDEATFNELKKIQSNLWDTQTELNARLEAGTLSPEAYLSRINAALKTSLENSQSLLGDEQFDAIFGDAGRHPEGLIDRDTFLTDVRRDLDHD